ncbi:NAD(P)-dependent oxidoreductase [Pararhodobacter sp. SW119]|uniref:NAD(P)-dependent oxidoreductase n=1 Tax=Pararhodobacter sp. SW119 TaxID=2780075 RepID=UPI001ADF1B6F|nr:NAD(P)-dependent oxidoreductase [Pararhodobacter sp. SW119]
MPDMPMVLLTNPIHPDGRAILEQHARLVEAPDTRAETLRSLTQDAAGIIVRCQLPSDILDHGPQLVGLVRHGVGLDFIPVEAATAAGVAVANLPGINAQAVAEYVFSALFHLRRRLAAIDEAHRSDGWDAGRSIAGDVLEIGGSTIGILGVGTIGSRIAEIARGGFGMRVLGVARRPETLAGDVEAVDLERLFSESDAVVLSCSLNDSTRGLVDARLIARMKPGAVLINVSRGAVLDATALAAALQEGRIAGAALDVYAEQPLERGSPLFDCPNLLMTTHVAAITATSMRAMSIGAAEEMCRLLTGAEPQNLVNPEYRTRRSSAPS